MNQNQTLDYGALLDLLLYVQQRQWWIDLQVACDVEPESLWVETA